MGITSSSINISNFAIRKGKKIGEGQKGQVYEGEIKSEGKKIVLKKQLRLEKQEEIIVEKLRGNKFDHIIEVLAYEGKSDGNTYILMEFGEKLHIQETNKEEYFLQMVKGVRQFHQLGFFHRTLKPGNFLIGENGQLKLSDFGITKEIKDTIYTNMIGTFQYMAPEVFVTQNYDQSVDIWSLGIIFFEILTNNLFFEDSKNFIEISKKIVEISQPQINSKIKQQNLQIWQEDILEKMIVQRLDKNQKIVKQIQRISIDAVVEEVEKQCQSLNTLEKVTFRWLEKTEEMQSYIWDANKSRFIRIQFQIQYLKDNQIVYIKNGIILKNDQILDVLVKPEVLNNLEQIKYMKWNGNYGQKKKKEGYRSITWKGQRIQGVGGQYREINKNLVYNNGNKQGQWVEIIPNYQRKAKATQIGQYLANKRRGLWMYKYKDQEMGGGEYNQLGLKTGKWIELWERFNDFAQIKEIGYYNLQGIKLGRWDSMFENKLIGGGLYNQDGNEKKIGKWVELDEGFCTNKQVTYNGEYNIQGLKIGRWKIQYCVWREMQHDQIGGGSYDQEGNQKKIGKWIELDEGFYRFNQVTYNGEYNMKGMKIGWWNSMYCLNGENEYKQIGGGQYDQDGNQKKIGKWIELDEGFFTYKQVTYNGEYNMQGMKNGRWNSMYCLSGDNEYKQIGGGSYDLEGNQKKIGKWVELDEGFQKNKQITYNGEYNKQGMKIGRWNSMHCLSGDNEYTQIGGGQYDEDGNQKKIGNWIEIDEEFQTFKQVTYHGQYDKQGQKIDKWNSMYCVSGEQEYKQIGGGSYDQEGNQKKIGKREELDEGFQKNKQITYNGEYNKQGMKIGRWNSRYCLSEENEYKQIGGGSYDQEGFQKKIGKWVELDEGFQIYKQVTSNGEYNKQGLKIGRWNSMYCVSGEQEYKQIGGGSYDQEGNQKKIGKWEELDEEFSSYKQVTYNGEYNMQDLKIDRWNSMYCGRGEMDYKQIGGGSYDQEGFQKKIGKWVELDEGFYTYKQVTYNGEYNRQGMKIGRWNSLFCISGENEYKQIGGGSYDQEGNQKKIGKWEELDERIDKDQKVTYIGEYNRNDMKIGRWNSMLENQQIGGGSYDQVGNQKKIGQWVVLDEKFYTNKQVTYNGEYNKQGLKIGRWNSLFCISGENEYKQIGGGSYDQEGNQKKIGKWEEFDERIDKDQKVTYIGEYNQNGMKIGRWNSMFENQQIGGGSYDQEGKQKKIGKWEELDDRIDKDQKVTYIGEYNQNGMKIGRWNSMFENQQIGGGAYDQDGNQIKIGKWVELDKRFFTYKQVTYNGEYNMQGSKIGRWNSMFCISGKKEYKQIGGGSYDKDGNQIKIGKWLELDEWFYSEQQVTYNGEYNMHGMKIGNWQKNNLI